MKPSRRQFLQRGSLALAAGLPIAALAKRVQAAGYGPLLPDPNGIFELPAGFEYRVVQQRGELMSDGFRTPGKMDGMTCFLGADNSYVILRNQELNSGHPEEERPFVGDTEPPANAYDLAEPGGVVRLVLDRDSLQIRDSRLVLYGTFMNCSGGNSPWGWLTCEEIDDFYEADAGLGHGYVFLVSPDDVGQNLPRAIPTYGRFRHEAAVVEAETLTCYLTEDRDLSCFYRFVPESANAPFAGVLQALKVKGVDNLSTGSELRQGQVLDVEWVTVDDPYALLTTTRAQAQSKGAAIFTRGEGIAEHKGDIYVCATTGGPQSLGQIFRYRAEPSAAAFDPSAGGTLELLLQNEDANQLAQPDNLVVAPWGDVYMCEDAFSGDQHLRALTPDGEIFTLGHNVHSSLELAGVCFSPDGRVLFVNLQHDGIMLAIRGPFPTTEVAPPAPLRPIPISLNSSSCQLAALRRNAALGNEAVAGAALFTSALVAASLRRRGA